MKPLSNKRILVVDDNASIHQDFLKILASPPLGSSTLQEAEAVLFGELETGPAKTQFELDFAFQGQEALEKVETALKAGMPYAVAFVDVRMPPGWDGIETIAQLWKADPNLQTVICTAYSDYSWEDMAAQLDVSDRLLILKKPFDNIEVLQLAHSLARKWEVTLQANLRMEHLDKMVSERTSALQNANEKLRLEMAERILAEEARRISEERFSKAFHASPMPLAIQELRTLRFVDANKSFSKLTGLALEEIVGQTPIRLNLGFDSESKLVRSLQDQKPVRNIECSISSACGESRQLLLSMELLDLEGDSQILVMMEDISERLRLESQLRHAQKMEAIGQLAAGIAHDFNNILTIISGYTSLQLTKTPDPATAESLRQVADASDRATKLTRQLLTFSRKQIMQPQALDLNDLLNHLSKMLRRIIGEDIALRCDYAPGLPCVFADPTNMEQIVMNLTVNARDAMPQGGELTITTFSETIQSADLPRSNPDARPGKFICLQVRDSGCGMDVPTLSRIFEPFFTTKDVGKGTGMGLATVYGIVKQHEGWIEVQSEPGKGTTFSIHLPASAHANGLAAGQITESPLSHGEGHLILVVEDDSTIRQLVQEILEHYHYQVLTATDSEEALTLWKDHSAEVGLLLTDMVMPGGKSGRDLAEQLFEERPDLKVVYTTGYSADLFGSKLRLEEGVNYLPKPYLASDLARIVRKALDS